MFLNFLYNFQFHEFFIVETPPTEAIRNNRKRNNKNDLGDEGSNKKTRVSEPVTPVATITPGQKRVVYTTNTNKPAVSTPSTVSNVSVSQTFHNLYTYK